MMLEYTVKVGARGTMSWWLNDKLHCEHGPAVERADGYKVWYLNGELHNEHGPAIEWANGEKAWYLNGKELTETEFNNRTACSGKVVEIEGVKYKLVEI